MKHPAKNRRRKMGLVMASICENDHSPTPGGQGIGHFLLNGYKCVVCGEFVEKLTHVHARRCGFNDPAEMIAAGVAIKVQHGKRIGGQRSDQSNQ